MATHSSILGWEIPWRSLVGYSPWGCKESDITEHHTPTVLGVLRTYRDDHSVFSEIVAWKVLYRSDAVSSLSDVQKKGCNRMRTRMIYPAWSEASSFRLEMKFEPNMKKQVVFLGRLCGSIQTIVTWRREGGWQRRTEGWRMGRWDQQSLCGRMWRWELRPVRRIILDMLFNFSKLQFLYL